MESIVPVRTHLSDRFPVASFSVRVPEQRYFEIACATDPRLFHPEWRSRRTPENFFTTRPHGLYRATRGESMWVIPPDQLRRFVGSPHVYYAMGTYVSPDERDPRFTIAPDRLDAVPSLSLGQDFTGRTLERSLLGTLHVGETTYGGGAPAEMTWGGDVALQREILRQRAVVGGYDDGHDPALWRGDGGPSVYGGAPRGEALTEVRRTPEPAAEERPTTFSSWETSVRSQRGVAPAAPLPISLISLPRAQGVDYRLESQGGRVTVVGTTTRVGERYFGPRPELVAVPARRGTPPRAIEGFRPPHLDLRALPAPLPRELERPTVRYQRTRPSPRVAGRAGADPLNVFGPDTRRVFSDTSYPWCTCGLIPEVGASGAMVGPRHVLTAAHALNISGGHLAPMSFVPLSFDGHGTFGSANVTIAYYFTRTTTNSINDTQIAFDYAVCVLDQRLGDIIGWLGTREYSTGWDGGSYWAHVGYPTDITNGRRPVFHGPGIIDSTAEESFGGRTGLRMAHQNDIEPGDSGGPFFGVWDGKHYIVGVQSAEDSASVGPFGPNYAGGGSPMVELVRYALDQRP